MSKAVLFLPFLVSLLLSQPGWASYPGACRAVNYGSRVHYISLNEDQQVAHYQFSSNVVSWDADPDAWLALPSGYKRQDPNDEDYGEGIVVYGSVMLHYAVIWGSNSTPWLLMSRYDLAQGKFIDSKLYGQQLSDTGRHGYGVAASVVSGTIYVFTSAFTLKSGDGGLSYTQLPAVLPTSLGNYEPTEALTFSPAEGPQKMLIAFAKDNTTGALYTTWDGSASLALPDNQFQQLGNANAKLRGAAMVIGTAGNWIYGKKVPSVQVFLFTHDYDENADVIRLREYDINADTMSLDTYSQNFYNHTIDRMRVFPWYLSSGPDPLGRTVQQQQINLNYYACTDGLCMGHTWITDQRFASDYLVPQNQDPATGGYGWEGLPTSTTDGTPEDLEILRQYWSLIGVILGPPPFAVNDLSEKDIHDLANVQYGSDSSNSVEHKTSWSNSVMASSGTEVKVGLSRETIDLSYQHAWEGSNTQATTFSTSIDNTCRTTDESAGYWGTHGWAIFAAPVLLVQDVELYAYDYDVQAMTGTSLEQDLTTITAAGPPPGSELAPITVQAIYFSLENPGEDSLLDQISGLMTGMTPYPKSTDLQGWSALTWEGLANQKWNVLYGTGTHGGSQVSTVSQGTFTEETFGSSTTSVSSTGQTNAIDLQVGFGIGEKTALKGIKETLTAGYQGDWSSETTTETEVSNAIKFWLHLPTVSDTCPADCVSQLTVQPYLLQATDYTAPWIPAGYHNSLPWCMTWQVKNYAYKEGMQAGESPLPARAGGTIVGRAGGRVASAKEKGWSHYWVQGGRMEWKGADGSRTPIPLTAHTFDPALGAVVSLNGHEIRMEPGLGRWRRNGHLWEFNTRESAHGSLVSLKLDFSRKTWSFAGDRLSLSRQFLAGDSNCRLQLAVNGKYLFFCDVAHRAESVWNLEAADPSSEGFSLSRASGLLNSETGEGSTRFEGQIPASLPGFGDVFFVFNGHQVDIPLLSQQGFVEAFERGKRFTFHEEGMHLSFDFGKHRWFAFFSKSSFDRLMAPRWGGLRFGIKLGGTTSYTKEHSVVNYTTKLYFDR